jgi:hypothetical protein
VDAHQYSEAIFEPEHQFPFRVTRRPNTEVRHVAAGDDGACVRLLSFCRDRVRSSPQFPCKHHAAGFDRPGLVYCLTCARSHRWVARSGAAGVPRSGLYRVYRQVAKGAVKRACGAYSRIYGYLPSYKTIKMEHVERLEQAGKINGLCRSTAGTFFAATLGTERKLGCWLLPPISSLRT